MPISASSILDCIGATPLVRLRSFPGGGSRISIFAKLEFLNPGGSVKDRPARAIVLEAERSGRLRPGIGILDATSGNTGIALALLGAALGYPVTLVLPANATEERKRLCRAYGARLILTEALEGSDGARARAREIAEAEPGRYFYANQYDNPANPRSHYETTAPEIWEQTGGAITHFVAGIGTGGTLVGTARRLRELQPAIEVVAVEPDSPLHGLEGLKHMASSLRPGVYDPSAHDRTVPSPTEAAHELCRDLLRREGLFVGHSSGAALYGALEVARGLRDGVIVTMFPDGGDRYLSLDRP